jgi:hypothetical protein
MSILNTKEGQSIQTFVSHLSPIKMWGFTTVSEEKMLRRFLYEQMPAASARKLLAKRFPKSGQFKKYIETQRNKIMGPDDESNVIRTVADEIIAEYLMEAVN